MKPITSTGKRFCVMMADDDEDDKFLLKSAFEEVGLCIPIKFSDNGADFLDHLKQLQDEIPLLIILDLNMPRKNGKDVLREIRGMKNWNQSVILIYSTSKSQRDIDDAYGLGCNAYIIKPGNYDEIVQIASGIKKFWMDDVMKPFYHKAPGHVKKLSDFSE